MRHSISLVLVAVFFTLMLGCKSDADQSAGRASVESVSMGDRQRPMENAAGVSQKVFISSADGRGLSTSGNITIEPSAFSYAKGVSVAAIITNGLELAIYTEDMKSDCSIAILEHWQLTGWQAMLNCGMERLPAISAIMPGQAMHVQINPWSSHFGVIPGSGEPGLGPGKYRFKFSYRLSQTPQGSEPYSVVSQEFAVTP
jgi:hypothetical protein